jgi:hypothetical protein
MQRRQKQNRPEGRPLHKEGESGGGEKRPKWRLALGQLVLRKEGAGAMI